MDATAKLRRITVVAHPAGCLLLLTAALMSLSIPLPALAQTGPPGFFIQNAFPTATFNLPTLIVFMPDGRKLVTEKEGRVWVITPQGTKLSTPFIDINLKVLSDDDRGLHGLALDPDFATNRWVYLLYTVDPDSDGVDTNIGAFGRLERYQTSLNNPNVLDLTTRQILIGQKWADGTPAPCRNMHHPVGTLRFARDKTLLIGNGDNANADITDAGGSDPESSFGPGLTNPAEDIGSFRARTLNSMAGKILRVDKETGFGLPSNPYWNGNPTSARSRVWLYGLRNPFRFSIRPGTGSTDPTAGQPGVLYIGDVGWNTTEELDICKQGGLNMGWPCIEGAYPQPSYDAVTQTFYPNPNVICSAAPSSENPAPNTMPILWWDHTNDQNSFPVGWVGNCSIGGVFYTGTSYPAAYRNAYYIADYGRGWIRRVQVDANDNLVAADSFIEGPGGIVDIEADPVSGDLFYIDINTNTIRRISYSSTNQPPVVNATLTPTSGPVPLTVTATASGSTDPNGDPLTFLWAFGDGGVSHAADTTYTYQTPGTYIATITVFDNQGGSSQVAFNVVAGQSAPPGTIVAPVDNSFFHQNASLPLTAAPVDTTQGPATYRWDIDLHHNNHIHPSVLTFFGQSTSFQPSTPNDGNFYYLGVRLSVTQGAVTSADTVRIWPMLNLHAASISFNPPAPLAGQTVQVTTHLKSIGEVGTSPSTYQIRDGATVIASGSLPAILNGDSLVVAVTVGPLSLGGHTIHFVADSADSLHETNEADNDISGTLTVGGLIAAYGFDEGSGSTTADISGHGFAGSIQGATWTTGGKYGKALSFNGTTDFVDLGNPALMQMTGSVTLSAWVKAASNPPDDGQIIAKSNDTAGWQLKTSPDTGSETFGMALFGSPSSYTGRYSTTVRSLNTWYHVAGVYDAGARTLQIYVNGSPNNGQLLGTVPPAQVDAAVNVMIGKRSGGYNFSGIIDEVRIYNRALTQQEIQADMNTPVSQIPVVGVPDDRRESPPPSGYFLSQSFPNPFNPRTTLRYTLAREGHVRIEVFNIAGELVGTIVDRVQAAGVHEAVFEPKGLAGGVYVCRMQAGDYVASRKLFLLR